MLIIEDGTIVEGANSYVTVAQADALLGLLKNLAWQAMDQDGKEATLALGAIVVNDGATYIYDGDRQTAVQEMPWPRIGATYNVGGPVVPQSTIPPEIKRAQIIAAGGLADGTIRAAGAGFDLINKSEKVDVISVEYFSPKDMATANTGKGGGPFANVGWPAVTAIVAPLLDDDFYAVGTAGARAARRGPRYKDPSYGGIWDVGQNDTYRTGRGPRSLLVSNAADGD